MIDYAELAEAMGDLDEDTVKELLPYHYRLLFPDPSGLLPVPPQECGTSAASGRPPAAGACAYRAADLLGAVRRFYHHRTVASAFAGGVSSAWYLLGTAVGCLLFLLLVFRFYRAVAVVKHSGSIPDAFAYRFDERTRVLMVLVIVITNSIALSTIPLSTAAIISKITGLSSDAAG